MRILFSCLVFITSFCLFFSQVAQAQILSSKNIAITIDQAKIQKSLIAMPDFQGRGSAGRLLYNTIRNNLDINSFFQLIDPKAFLEDSNVSVRPHPEDPKGFKFENWKVINAEFLIRGRHRISRGQLYFESYVYHVPRSKLIFKKEYNARVRRAKWIAHTFSNDLFKTLTGRDGMFLSQIAVGSDRSGGKWREIYIMDWDGENMQRLTRHRSISLSPSWSPNGRSIAYSTYTLRRDRSSGGKVTNLDLFHLNIASRNRRMLSGKRGLNSGSVFHTNGRYVFLSLTSQGSADIFRVRTTNRKDVARITRGPYRAMNVEPSVSPDGRKIAFSSDRSGRPMIYIMNADGSGAKRLTFAGYYNSSPSWSPDGKWIAFSSYQRGYNDIFVIRPNGTGLKRLTSSRGENGKRANNEEPTFSPDSGHVMFVSDRTGKKQLYIVGIDGTNEKKITSDNHNYYKPKWGPSLSR